MSLTITGHDLKIKDVVDVSRNYKKVVLSEDSIFLIAGTHSFYLSNSPHQQKYHTINAH